MACYVNEQKRIAECTSQVYFHYLLCIFRQLFDTSIFRVPFLTLVFIRFFAMILQVKKCADQINGMDNLLVQPSRKYVFEGLLYDSDDKLRYLFLFNDLLVVTSPVRGKLFSPTSTEHPREFTFRYSLSLDEWEVSFFVL